MQILSTILKQGSLELDQGGGDKAYSTVIQLRMLSEILSENISSPGPCVYIFYI